jgi:hypothetical protein
VTRGAGSRLHFPVGTAWIRWGVIVVMTARHIAMRRRDRRPWVRRLPWLVAAFAALAGAAPASAGTFTYVAGTFCDSPVRSGTLYPLVARATYPPLGFPQYAGEVAASEADDAMKAKA